MCGCATWNGSCAVWAHWEWLVGAAILLSSLMKTDAASKLTDAPFIEQRGRCELMDQISVRLGATCVMRGTSKRGEVHGVIL